MIELPEALVLASQINDALQGKRIAGVTAGASPHKFAFFHGDPAQYHALLRGKKIGSANAFGGFVEIEADEMRLLFNDGVALRLHRHIEDRPTKHQLLIEFDDSCALSASVQMYGGLLAFKEGVLDNRYYAIAKAAPSPLSDSFNGEYFENLLAAAPVQKLSAKAFLATEQRIPGLGNGVLQDILYKARVHPKRKVDTLSAKEKNALFTAVKSTLSEMYKKGGRDTEKDLYGNAGGYRTKLSKNTVGQPCSRCGAPIAKDAYLGGAIYYCGECQKL